MGGALRTDLYELNMAASYLRRGMTGTATFSLFVRELPPGWGFLVACGLEHCLDYLESLSFWEEELAWLAETQGYDEETIEAFRGLRFTGDVAAVPEGRVIYANEPILEVTAPLPEAQLAEAALLNQITYQTAVATTAARCRLVAPDRDLVDFAFRRAHGTEAGIGVARATAIAGFIATSNVEAARVLGLQAAGTMAHSYIEAFDSEEEAFLAFAEDFPDRVILLVDTYDTLRGVDKAVEVARVLSERSVRVSGIRLDSGDLAALARGARARLDEAGLTEVRIFASGGLDERAIADLADAPIDAYGVGSKVGVSAGAPYLDSVYKLVEYEGRPVAKLSTAKETLPGRKQVWRHSEGDVIGLRNEDGPSGAEPLLSSVMEGGHRVERGGWEPARDRLARELAALPGPLRSLDASPPLVDRSINLRRVADGVRARLLAEEVG